MSRVTTFLSYKVNVLGAPATTRIRDYRSVLRVVDLLGRVALLRNEMELSKESVYSPDVHAHVTPCVIPAGWQRARRGRYVF